MHANAPSLRGSSRWHGALAPLLLGLLMCLAGATAHGETPALVLERTIALKDVRGRIDHMAIDLARGRLFVAELGNGTVDVIDLGTERAVGRIEGLKEPQGLAYLAGSDVLAVASAGDGSVRLFRGDSLAALGRIDLGDDADNVRVDRSSGSLVVGYGSGGLAVIRGSAPALLSRIGLPAHPEGFQIDADQHRAYVNLPDAHAIAVVDLEAGRQVGGWHMPPFHANYPIALDAAHGIAAVGFRNPPRLVVYNARTGDATSIVPTCGDADDLFFDTRRRRIYVSCGAGLVDAWEQDSGTYRHLQPLPTRLGARTALFVPELDRLFVAAPPAGVGPHANAAILVMRPIPSAP